ncbi:MAG: transcriptional regulator [Caldisericaceae bacterium]|nr:transcriptional regulator [Caldisericaceae bacterium]
MNEKLFGSPARIKILTAIATEEGIDFTSLKNRTGLTDGNLSSHLAKLEKENIVEIRKTFVKKRPKTQYFLTQEGKEKFISYLDEIERILNKIKEAKK